MANPNPCLDAALKYADAGVSVFPANVADKRPHKAGKNSNGKRWGATKLATEIKRDFKKWPNAAVCIPTGVENGIFVIEADTKEGHDIDGIANLNALIAANSPLPETRMARSPSGSLHYYFRYPDEGFIRNSASSIAPGVDARGEGGMVVAPPSVKPGVGQYEWLNNKPFVDAPQWLLDIVIDKDGERLPGEQQSSVMKIAYALSLIPNRDVGWEEWNRIGMAAWLATCGHQTAFEAWDKWSQQSKKYDLAVNKDRWFKRYPTTPPTTIGAGTIYRLASLQQPGWMVSYSLEHPDDDDDKHRKEIFKEEIRAKEDIKTRTAIEKGEYSIKIYEDDLHKAVDLTEECMIKNKSPFYVYAKQLVTPIVIELNTSKKEIKTKIASFVNVDIDYLTDHANRFIDYKKYNVKEKDWKSIDPPQKVVTRLMSRVNDLRFPKVTGIITTQTMRPDGTLLIEPGWDEATGLLLVDPPPMTTIEINPSRGAVLESKELLIDLLEEVKYADDEGISLAVLLSELLTPVLRGAFSVCPMHVNRSPSPGSGKSYMFDIVSHIVIGQPMPVMAAGRNSEETEKRLGAALMSGQPLINIDNIAGELGGDALCQIIERPIVNIRVLGKSELRTIVSRGTSLFCNGNNMVLTGDVVRRAIIATIDTGMERPELRTFKKSPINMVMKDRGKYIAACLTLARGYLAAGSPNKPAQLGSFGEWSDVVRGTIVWLGMADPVRSMEFGRDEDPDLAAHRDYCKCAFDVMGGGQQFAYSALNIVETAEEKGKSGYDQYVYAYPEFQMIVQQIAGFHGKAPEALRMSRWLRVKKNRPVYNLVIRAKQLGNHTVWWIEKVDDPRSSFHGLNNPDRDTGNVSQFHKRN